MNNFLKFKYLDHARKEIKIHNALFDHQENFESNIQCCCLFKKINMLNRRSCKSNTCTSDLFRFPTLFIRMLNYNITQKLKTEKCFIKFKKITLKTTWFSVLFNNWRELEICFFSSTIHGVINHIEEKKIRTR